jgi:hypothetical protein
MTYADLIFSIIARHRGSENAISASEISEELGCYPGERAVRRIIASLYDCRATSSRAPIVCAKLRGRSDEGGYFTPETFEEIEAYWAYLSDLAYKAEAKVHRFEQACAKAGFKLGPADLSYVAPAKEEAA